MSKFFRSQCFEGYSVMFFFENPLWVCCFLSLTFFYYIIYTCKNLKQMYVEKALSRYITGCCMFLFSCTFNSLNIKERTQKQITKYFYKGCFAVLYKLTISIKPGKRQEVISNILSINKFANTIHFPKNPGFLDSLFTVLFLSHCYFHM